MLWQALRQFNNKHEDLTGLWKRFDIVGGLKLTESMFYLIKVYESQYIAYLATRGSKRETAK